MLALRQIDERIRILSQAAERWQTQGWACSLSTPPTHGWWLPIGDEAQAWQGWLPLHDWLARTVPELAALATSAHAQKLIVPWLAAVEQPFSLPVPELAYRSLRICEPVTGGELPAHRLLHIANDEVQLWLERVPLSPATATRQFPRLRWPLSLVMGESTIRLLRLNQIRPGDVLLIQKTLNLARCNRAALGNFQQIQGGIVMENFNVTHQGQEESSVSQGLGNLPVTLEFVLHHSRVSLSELQALSQGQVLPLPADAEKHVEIRANGALLGRGELVQVDNRLGVEVSEWLGANDHEQ
ncbi:YscQ/HrcQ family type III secretion apparatus protein [Dryocola sp. BD626]|uniref:YscQ/HrcQ family type III secretion apparatus protein n=1 Tax=Dryocola sp. BD626 TaxID=3133273 RepID=UPI003F507F44